MDFTLFACEGRLVDDPKMWQSDGGNKVCRFTVATNRKVGKEERTSYIPVTVFGKDAELCSTYLSKGREVNLSGTFETDRYTDKEKVVRTGFSCVISSLNGGFIRFGRGGRKKDDNAQEEAVAKITQKMKAGRGR